jgi:hypothetical protein
MASPAMRTPSLAFQAREPLADRMKAQEQLPGEFGLALDDGVRAQHLALSRGQAKPLDMERSHARDVRETPGFTADAPPSSAPSGDSKNERGGRRSGSVDWIAFGCTPI